MGGWDAVAASVSGVNPSAYGSQGGPMYRPVVKPTEYTDDTLITVPVLDLEALQGGHGSNDEGALGELSKKEGKLQNRSTFFRHKPSSSQSASNRKVNVSIRQGTRRQYLKHYAKDGQGRYIGTEDPAEDCVLDGEDSSRWRGQPTGSGIATAGGTSTADETNPKAPVETPNVVKDAADRRGNRPSKRSTRKRNQVKTTLKLLT
ncbi:uncharacterized protein PV07_03300 [Cladophialophora immunda]|uniref:Uncharacterized protein n=1 Tax=Cladophialophora immunda TaxID=569365 RepID=A0A0D2CKH7_9EURO|nr:uncharacterized protein PV07_03300 [Cladophialophora immunda]KIW31698.1 hypothetical protein PV07_03300 [Cladophialophora immunda]